MTRRHYWFCALALARGTWNLTLQLRSPFKKKVGRYADSSPTEIPKTSVKPFYAPICGLSENHRFQYWSFFLLTCGEKGEISPQLIEKILSRPTSERAAIFDFKWYTRKSMTFCARQKMSGVNATIIMLAHTITDPLRTRTCRYVIDLRVYHINLKSKMAALSLVGREKIFSIN